MNELTPRRIMPVVIGIAVTALFLLLLGILAQRRDHEEAAVPALTIIAPSSDAFVDSPLVVRFRSTQSLMQMPAGWGRGRLHLHAWVNDIQLMPAAADIRAQPDGSYEWALPAPRGPVQVWLGWADVTHQPVDAGASQLVSVTVK